MKLSELITDENKTVTRFLLGAFPELYKKYVIESHGEHMGLHWLVMFRGMGHRCGYVQAPDIFKNWKYEDIEAIEKSLDDNCPHGGVTFVGELQRLLDEEDLKNHPQGIYVGFDAIHGNDLSDFEFVLKYFPDEQAKDEHINYLLRIEKELEETVAHIQPDTFSKIRTESYMREECFRLARGLREIEHESLTEH